MNKSIIHSNTTYCRNKLVNLDSDEENSVSENSVNAKKRIGEPLEPRVIKKQCQNTIGVEVKAINLRDIGREEDYSDFVVVKFCTEMALCSPEVLGINKINLLLDLAHACFNLKKIEKLIEIKNEVFLMPECTNSHKFLIYFLLINIYIIQGNIEEVKTYVNIIVTPAYIEFIDCFLMQKILNQYYQSSEYLAAQKLLVILDTFPRISEQEKVELKIDFILKCTKDATFNTEKAIINLFGIPLYNHINKRPLYEKLFSMICSYLSKKQFDIVYKILICLNNIKCENILKIELLCKCLKISDNLYDQVIILDTIFHMTRLVKFKSKDDFLYTFYKFIDYNEFKDIVFKMDSHYEENKWIENLIEYFSIR